MKFNYHTYNKSENLPVNWDAIVAKENILLSKSYFSALLQSQPINMENKMLGFFKDDKLIGGALFQTIIFKSHKSFNPEKNKYSGLKNKILHLFSNKLLILGNNMLSGQNGFYFDLNIISKEDSIKVLSSALQDIQKEEKALNLFVVKDFNERLKDIFNDQFESFYRFENQPMMILNLKKEWNTFEDYTASFTKKYRARIRVALKKSAGIQKKELQLVDLENYAPEIFRLYSNVANNAVFNTFNLEKNHFIKLKEFLQENFKVFGYFKEDKLIGFYTLILNGNEIDTYFLGYDTLELREHQIYLNMLIDMVQFGIVKKIKKINFGRTALEIKSTIGAEPKRLYSYMNHQNKILKKVTPYIFQFSTPQIDWIQRNPFKEIK